MNSLAVVRPIFPAPIIPTVQFLTSLLNIVASIVKSPLLVLFTVYAVCLKSIIPKVTASSDIAFGEYPGTLADFNPNSLTASKST